ncbi:WXG100 family type VII secretion target [Cellulomonas endophytica]|uniref:WXG100 family type VII secretion target n=1 Tax=Cellulomonas endophytica TaxID=2494735 RepID=UPI0010128A8A|nr:WXG100 family type VII secretion target [Cellulomonas endophytica]
MSRYEVDSEALAVTAGRVRSRGLAVRAEAEALRRELADLGAVWTGPAAAACAEAVALWSHGQVLLEATLDQMEASLHGAAQTYADADGVAARLFGG